MYYHTDSHWLSLHCFGITKTMVSVRCVQQFDAKLNFWIMRGDIRKGCGNIFLPSTCFSNCELNL